VGAVPWDDLKSVLAFVSMFIFVSLKGVRVGDSADSVGIIDFMEVSILRLTGLWLWDAWRPSGDLMGDNDCEDRRN
jgi:hypothetical protein